MLHMQLDRCFVAPVEQYLNIHVTWVLLRCFSSPTPAQALLWVTQIFGIVRGSNVSQEYHPYTSPMSPTNKAGNNLQHNSKLSWNSHFVETTSHTFNKIPTYKKLN